MVKGVNKTVIEVCDTGSKMFEKIVFYVSPQYGSLSAKQLSRAAREFSFSFNGVDGGRNRSLRSIVNKKRKKKIYFGIGAAAVALSGSLLLAFLI